MRRLSAIVVLIALASGSIAATDDPAADLFSGAALEDLWVRINARDWQTLRERHMDNTFYPCDLQWRGVSVVNAGCRSRGLGSRNGTKPGLLVDFDRYVGGQRFLGLASLVLDNHWQDASMLKEHLAMRLFDRMGVPAPRTAHVRLFVGSGREYAGVYSVVEDIDEAFLRRRFGEDDGYLYEYHWMDAYHLQDHGWDFEEYARRFEARTHQTASPFALYAPLQALVRAINEADAADLDAALAEYLDLRGVIAQLAAENFLADNDGLLGYAGMDNFYLYRPASGAARLIPWDKDNAFAAVDLPPFHGFAANVLARKIQAHPALSRYYLQCLLDAAAAGATMEADLNEAFAHIRAAALADALKPVSGLEFEEAVAAVTAFSRERSRIVRGLVRQLDPGLSGTSPSRYRPVLRPR